MTDVSRQLEDDLDRALTGPVGALLGLDLAEKIRERITARAPMLAAQLTQDADDRLAGETVIDVWPSGDPDPDWWRTPLGRVCARSLGNDDAEAVTHSVAAAMLGVTRGTVAQLVHRGTLDRHPDGGVTRASVLMRIGRGAS
jgi:hypothetical protein